MTSPLAISFTGEPVRTPEQRQKRQEHQVSAVLQVLLQQRDLRAKEP